MTKDELLAELQKKIDGLYFPSESDFPFEIIVWENFANDMFNAEKWLEREGLATNAPLENATIEYLFRNLAVEQEWHDDVQREQVARFKALQDFLQANLSDLTVYRVGKINVTIFIIGKFGNDVVGLKTEAVET
ncbi:MAG: nuclease A inhibitor family protein [Chloroherpetonaceae bacterium]|nr:nuclease A inhibitor family protein [Chloroherpetonaceae bacterium]MDW8436979.1 nuclease A inhibitor family protein [Chloroherpetonaceae bacterium]